jgi:hypothetical protein
MPSKRTETRRCGGRRKGDVRLSAFFLLLGALAIAGALVLRGYWEFLPSGQTGGSPYIWRVNHVTGEVDFCVASAGAVGGDIAVHCYKRQ